MKKYLNKALLLKEWKSVWWLMIPMFLLESRIREVTQILEWMKSETHVGMSRLQFFNNYNVVALIVVAIIAAFLICMDRKTNGYEIMSHMPYNKTEIIISKWIAGIIVIAIPTIIDFIAVTMLYLCNRTLIAATSSNFFRYDYILEFYIIAMMTYALILTIFMLFQCITNNEFFGTIAGICIIVLPNSIGGFVDKLTYSKIVGNGYGEYILSQIYSVLNYLFVPSNFYYRTNAFDFSMHQISTQFAPRFILAILLVENSLILLMRLFNNTKLEEDTYMASRKAEIIFKIVISISMGLAAAGLVSRLLNVYTSRSAFVLIMNLVFIIAAYYVYGLVDRIIKLSKF